MASGLECVTAGRSKARTRVRQGAARGLPLAILAGRARAFGSGLEGRRAHQPSRRGARLHGAVAQRTRRSLGNPCSGIAAVAGDHCA